MQLNYTTNRIRAAMVMLLLIVPSSSINAEQVGPFSTATPESQGLSTPKLEAMKGALAARKTKALLVIRNDKIIYEWYVDGHSATTRHYTASMAKAVVAGVALGVALTDGRLALDDPAAKFIPQWRNDPRKSKITLRQLGSHTAGLEDAEANNLAHEKLTGWKGDFWKRLNPPNDPFTISRDQSKILFDPGSKFDYSNPGIAMLTYALTASLKDAPQKDLRTLLRDRVMRPIGVPDAEWSIGYGQTTAVDGLPLVASWGGANYTARAAAHIGRLMLRDGEWDGKQLLSKDAVHQITTDANTPGNCGIGWWSNNFARYEKLPKDAFWGSGAGHQILLVVPSLKLIAVRNGDALGPAQAEPSQYHEPVRQFLFEPLIDSITGNPKADAADPPYPPSPIIARIDWSPPQTIIRKAKGSDNWPITWADDDHLYTAFGDGNGFEPFLPQKLSLGLARIDGTPANPLGLNLRSPTFEQKGDGKAGLKASGMLFVDDTLFICVRNSGNSQLAWSNDHGRTWTWCDWKFTASFGCPTFLNFGPNYAGARDNFVYLFSPDSNDAYTSSDRMVLARVPKSRLRERAAYEFLQTIGKNFVLWSSDISQRGPVFLHPGKCYRSGITYNAPLKRYLWCQTLPSTDPRFKGGLAIYDAREPWGPWTTAYYNENWDTAPGESSTFPTKWITPDGKTLHLVFSGEDSFSVREAKLMLH
ncbi:MAG TPA: serine hydrolase [Tepidisphaeraceae bacterium]|nr:serine hydrolase [Tepidisphaeraceae bacterium]